MYAEAACIVLVAFEEVLGGELNHGTGLVSIFIGDIESGGEHVGGGDCP